VDDGGRVKVKVKSVVKTVTDGTSAAAEVTTAVTSVVEVNGVTEVANVVGVATGATAEDAVSALLAVEKVKLWFGSAGLQGASSITFAAVTVKHVPTAFSGVRARGPAVPLKGKSWEFVTDPPPSARPPHENMMTVSPAALLGSKFMHACVKVLTTNIELATLLCTPAVITSHN